MDGIIGVAIFIVVIFLFTLFMQFMSKISGRNIVRKGSRRVAYSPDDFDNTMGFLKEKVIDANAAIKKIGRSQVEQMIIEIDNILKTPQLMFSKYLAIKDEQLRITDLLEEREIKLREIERKRINEKFVLYDDDIENTFKNMRISTQINSLKVNALFYEKFDEEDIKKIVSFFEEFFKNDHQIIIAFFDTVGCENLKGLSTEISKMELLFLKSKLTKEEIAKIRVYILKKQGFIENLSI